MASLLDVLFGCSHKNRSFPLTRKQGQRRSAAASVTGTYIVCLDCGKEFAYDWQEMKVVRSKVNDDKGLAAKAAQSYAAGK